MADTTRSQVWTCTVAQGKTVRLSDIPIDDFIAVASRFGLDWGDVYARPLYNAAAAKALYEMCCNRLGVTFDANITAGQLLAAFDLVDEDLPRSFGAGDPSPADASTTSS